MFLALEVDEGSTARKPGWFLRLTYLQTVSAIHICSSINLPSLPSPPLHFLTLLH